MILGDLMARLDDERLATETLLATGDLALIAQVQRLAGAREQTVGGIIADAIAAFSSTASPDDWMQLMSAANRTENPGGAVLRQIMTTSKTRPPKSYDGGPHGEP